MTFDWRPLMGKITAAFRQELGENLTGIYLHGSAAFGSMSEGSDLDFIAVTERPPTQEQKEHLIKMGRHQQYGTNTIVYHLNVFLMRLVQVKH